MKERGILFSGEMVRATLDGRKTQTRRVINPRIFVELRTSDDPESFVTGAVNQSDPEFGAALLEYGRCPFGQPGDRLWVREKFCAGVEPPGVGFGIIPVSGPINGRNKIVYAATSDYGQAPPPWRPSIHMPRWASRITVEVTGVRVERVQDITGDDAGAEGADPLHCYGPGCDESCNQRGCFGAREWYQELWNSLNEKRGYGWDVNPYVWVIEFRRVDEQRAAA